MKIEYRIKVKQKNNPQVSLSTYSDNSTLTINKNFQGITFNSSEKFKGGFHRKSNKIVSRYKFKSQTIFGEELKESISKEIKEYSKVSFPVIDINNFMNTFRSYISFVKDLTLNSIINSNDNYDLLYLNSLDNKIYRISKEEYSLEKVTNKIIFNKSFNIKNKYLITIHFPFNYSYEKEDNKIFFDVESLISIDSGFYNLVNKKILFPYTIDIKNDTVRISTTEVLNLNSSFNISFGSISTNSYFIPPNTQIKASYNPQDYTPLVGKTSFNYSNDLMYIIYELKDNIYTPKYKLPRDQNNTDLKLLLQSHDEFKRPYVFIANKSNLVIKDILRNEESLTVNNPNFKELYNNF